MHSYVCKIRVNFRGHCHTYKKHKRPGIIDCFKDEIIGSRVNDANINILVCKSGALFNHFNTL